MRDLYLIWGRRELGWERGGWEAMGGRMVGGWRRGVKKGMEGIKTIPEPAPVIIATFPSTSKSTIRCISSL